EPTDRLADLMAHDGPQRVVVGILDQLANAAAVRPAHDALARVGQDDVDNVRAELVVVAHDLHAAGRRVELERECKAGDRGRHRDPPWAAAGCRHRAAFDSVTTRLITDPPRPWRSRRSSPSRPRSAA